MSYDSYVTFWGFKFKHHTQGVYIIAIDLFLGDI